MARLSPENLEIALEIVSRYPIKKSALIPLLHLAQEQDGWVADDADQRPAEKIAPGDVSYFTCLHRRGQLMSRCDDCKHSREDAA